VKEFAFSFIGVRLLSLPYLSSFSFITISQIKIGNQRLCYRVQFAGLLHQVLRPPFAGLRFMVYPQQNLLYFQS
jgi:hypothetical protein